MKYIDIDDYSYITSTLGNAYFSGITFSEMWECVSISSSREDLDVSVETLIKLKEITKGESS